MTMFEQLSLVMYIPYFPSHFIFPDTTYCYLILFNYIIIGFLGGSDSKESGAMQDIQVQSLGWEDYLEEGMGLLSLIPLITI